MLMASPKDTRMMVVYGYARLVGYTPALELAPDILKAIDVEDNRIFTLHLRKGHKWSDGSPSPRRISATGSRMWRNNSHLSPLGAADVDAAAGRGAALRGAGRDDRALHLGAAQPALPAGARRRRARSTSIAPPII